MVMHSVTSCPILPSPFIQSCCYNQINNNLYFNGGQCNTQAICQVHKSKNGISENSFLTLNRQVSLDFSTSLSLDERRNSEGLQEVQKIEPSSPFHTVFETNTIFSATSQQNAIKLIDTTNQKTIIDPDKYNKDENGKKKVSIGTNTDKISSYISPVKYDIIKNIGDGMLGKVFLIQNKNVPDELVALKVMNKEAVLSQRQTDHVLNEKYILGEIKHPFVVKMYYTRHDDYHLYIYLEYIPGGELHRYIKALKQLSADATRFYTAQVISALSYLHSLNIVFRDLKPENVILDIEGNLRLIDFGFAKRVTHSTWTLCGTLRYLAPEVICKRAYTKAVDWWALGIMTFEMLTGAPPFDHPSADQIPNQILNGTVNFPPANADCDARDFIRRLLVREPHRRLGSNRSGSADIKRHKWFKSLSFADMEAKRLIPPIVPSAFCDKIGAQYPAQKLETIHLNGEIEWLPNFIWNGYAFIKNPSKQHRSSQNVQQIVAKHDVSITMLSDNFERQIEQQDDFAKESIRDTRLRNTAVELNEDPFLYF